MKAALEWLWEQPEYRRLEIWAKIILHHMLLVANDDGTGAITPTDMRRYYHDLFSGHPRPRLRRLLVEITATGLATITTDQDIKTKTYRDPYRKIVHRFELTAKLRDLLTSAA